MSQRCDLSLDMNFLRFICTWPTQTKGNHTQYSECTCVLTGTLRELRRGLSCHAQAPSFRLWAGHSPVSPLQCSPAQVSGQSCCYTIIHMSAWKWSMCGKLSGSEWGLSSAFQECFSKTVLFQNTQVDMSAAVVMSGRSHWCSHWSSPPLGRSTAHKVSGR